MALVEPEFETPRKSNVMTYLIFGSPIASLSKEIASWKAG